MNKPLVIGAHMGGHEQQEASLIKAHALGFNAFQCFAVDPLTYFLKKGSEDAFLREAYSFRATKQRLGMTVSVHGNYVSNFAYPGPSRNTYKVSVSALKHIVWCATQMGADFVVAHVGSVKELGVQAGRSAVVDAVGSVLSALESESPTLLLETAAMGGTQFGAPDQLLELCERVNHQKFGFCLDTAHSYAGGIDFGDLPEIRSRLDEIRRLSESLPADQSWMKLVHLNNPEPNVKLGYHLDRHKSAWPLAKFPPSHMIDLVKVFAGYPVILEMGSFEAYENARNFLREACIL